MNMRKNVLIKTGLYFILAVLVLTSAVVVVYTARRSDGNTATGTPEPLQGQQTVIEDAGKDLLQVSSTPRPELSDSEPRDPDGSQQTKASAPEQTTYMIAVTDGCLQVYIAETGVLYMETAIEYDLLPENVRAQIDTGKYFESEEVLLEFLENYSS